MISYKIIENTSNFNLAKYKNISFGIGLRISIYLKLNICKMIMLEINFCNKTSLKTNCHSPLNTPYANVCLLSNLAECHDANWVHVKGCFD